MRGYARGAPWWIASASAPRGVCDPQGKGTDTASERCWHLCAWVRRQRQPVLADGWLTA